MILKYNSFLEARGIADPTLPYISNVLKISLDIFDEYVSSEESTISKRKVFSKEEILKWMTLEEWSKLPISEIDLEIKFYIDEDEDPKKPFFTTGLCYNMDEKDGTRLKDDGSIFLRMLISGELTQLYTPEDFERFKIDLESSVYHEFNHAYEGYMRKIKNYPPLQDGITFAVDANTEDVPDEVWDIWWNEVGYYLYWTETQEMNAISQESLPYIRKYDINWMKSNHPMWENIQSMLKFKADVFKSKIIDVIKEHMKDEDPSEVLTKMKNGFAKKILELMEEKGEKNPSIPPNKIKNQTIDQFLSYCERRFHDRAEKLKRRILKNYSRND